MAKYVYLYSSSGVAETPESQEQVMKAWTDWFGDLGPAIVDPGNPFGASAALLADGSPTTVGSGIAGYTVITADSLDDATTKAKGCPHLTSGGTVEIFEALQM